MCITNPSYCRPTMENQSSTTPPSGQRRRSKRNSPISDGNNNEALHLKNKAAPGGSSHPNTTRPAMTPTTTRRKRLFLSSLSSSSSSSPPQQQQQKRPYRFGTLCLRNVADLERALQDQHKKRNTITTTTTTTTAHFFPMMMGFWWKRPPKKPEPQLLPKTILFSDGLVRELPQILARLRQHHHPPNTATTHYSKNSSSRGEKAVRKLLGRGALRLVVVGNYRSNSSRSIRRNRTSRSLWDTDLVVILERLASECLEEVRLENIHIEAKTANNEDDEQEQEDGKSDRLATELRRMNNLKTLQIVGSSHLDDDILQQLLSVVFPGGNEKQTLPHLTHLSLELQAITLHQKQLLEEAMIRASNAPCCLRSLVLPFYSKDCRFWKALSSLAAKTLQSLTIMCFETLELNHLEGFLGHPYQQLQRLELCLLDSTACVESSHIQSTILLEGLLKGLCLNKSLTSLHVVTRMAPLPVGTVQQEARQIPDTRTVASRTKSLVELLYESMLPVLEHHNYTLRDISCIFWNSSHSCCRALGMPPSLAFYCHLNERGRDQYLSGNDSFPRQEQHRIRMVMEAASSSTHHPGKGSWKSRKDDLSTLYYWLRMQPTLLLK